MAQQQPQIPFLPGASSEGNRFQQRVIEAIRTLWSLIYIPVYTSSSRPTASEQWAGRFIRVRDSGQPEQLQFCLRQADGAFAWAIVSISPA